ncbi:uncharacterized protein LOC133893353 isoform X2 [Phragmites australis]|uniref:uncharacterized protein LOC133893353 isoform X2 n=1 Tax=Phragmites australis TaxID=29695 RepID=UPI002D76F900|nr:uncharacterized protein LOC133893353 isoform X2 [Phragmites australis]
MAEDSPEQQQRSVEARETVELTEKEERIFRRLLDVVRHLDLATQLRVAGAFLRGTTWTPSGTPASTSPSAASPTPPSPAPSQASSSSDRDPAVLYVLVQ